MIGETKRSTKILDKFIKEHRDPLMNNLNKLTEKIYEFQNDVFEKYVEGKLDDTEYKYLYTLSKNWIKQGQERFNSMN